MSGSTLVLGTAGHIDHGKSALIEALTGTDPDRLPEEKKRGVTIELGFARLDLPSGRSMGVVDVPGHERFVRQMVAGATGIDVVLLVVAADDGVMPQTREHLAILDLLGISRGVVAITKSDLVDDEWIDLVRSDVERLLEGTTVEGAPIVAVSAKTGTGLPELLAALDRVADQTASRQSDLPMRLPVDRVFTIAGAGTVVTGTMWSGTVAADDSVQTYPDNVRGRVRGVQVHDESVDRAQAGQRVAINIAGVERNEIARGDVLAEPGSLTVTDRFDVRFTYLGVPGSDKSFQSGSRVHIDHGTREVLGRVLLMGGGTLTPGDSALAQVRLEEPLAPRYDDRFIIRSYSPVYTIGGGMVLDANPPRRTTLDAHERESLEARAAHDVDQALAGLLKSCSLPMSPGEIASRLGVALGRVTEALSSAELECLTTAGESYFTTSEALATLISTVEQQLRSFHADNPSESSISAAALRDLVCRQCDDRVFDAIMQEAVARGVAVVEGGRVHHPEAAAAAKSAERETAEKLLHILGSSVLEPPAIAELASETGAEINVVRRALGALVSEGSVVRVSGELHFSAAAIDDARMRLRSVLADSTEGATAARLRDALGVSRKFAIPLLEYFDAQGFTRREGDVRTLRESAAWQ